MARDGLVVMLGGSLNLGGLVTAGCQIRCRRDIQSDERDLT